MWTDMAPEQTSTKMQKPRCFQNKAAFAKYMKALPVISAIWDKAFYICMTYNLQVISTGKLMK
jgi:hypothetical protein